MRRRPKREASDPIAVSDRSMRFHVKQRDVLANRERSDLAAFLHDEPRWKNPGEPDPAAGMNLEAELFLEERSPHFPGESKAQEHQDSFHNGAPSCR